MAKTSDCGGHVVYLKRSSYELLDAHENSFLNYIKKNYFSWGANDTLTTYLQNGFSSFSNPYVTALKFAYCSGDFHSCKPKSLALFIIVKFSEWLKKNMVEPLADQQIKIDALQLILEQKNNMFRDLVIQVFNMPCDNNVFVPLVQDLINKKKYKDACQVANVLQLHSKFSPEDFLLPLCVQDKLGIVESFLANDKSALTSFLLYMDQLVASDTFNKVTAIIQEKGIPDSKASRCGHKPLIKLMVRLIKGNDVPQSLCPNMEKRRKMSALHYLIAKRFNASDGGQSVGAESWEEMALDAVGDCPDLQFELVDGIFQRGEIEEAERWATMFGLPEEKWPERMVQYKTSDHKESMSPRKSRNVATPVVNEYDKYCIPLEYDKIILIDNAEEFSIFLEALHKVDLVGIDAEWKPSLVKRNELALIQVATRSEVYIIDRIALGQSIPDQLSSGLLDRIFHNKDILKLGFDFSTDVRELREVLPDLKEIVNLLDLSTLRNVLREKHNFQFPYGCDGTDGGIGAKLKNLVELCFNKTLDKTEQCSNWERRPLRPSQLEYAATDAYCLIDIFDAISFECEKQNIAVQEVVDGLLNRPLKSPAKSKARKTASPSVPGSKDIHFICTWELARLYRRLRRCGIDTLYNDSRQPSKLHMKLLRNGYILLTSVGQTWLTSKITHHRVAAVDEQTQLHQLLKSFGVDVLTEDTIFRCTECNKTELAPLAVADLQALRNYTKVITNAIPAEEYRSASYDDDDDCFYDDDEDLDYAPAAVRPAEQGPNRLTSRGAAIQAEAVPDAVLDRVQTFYLCQDCGYVTWPTTLNDMFLYD